MRCTASCFGRRFASRIEQEGFSENPSGRCPNPRRCPTRVEAIVFRLGPGSAGRGLRGEEPFRSAASEQAPSRRRPRYLINGAGMRRTMRQAVYPRRPFALARKPKRAKAATSCVGPARRGRVRKTQNGGQPRKGLAAVRFSNMQELQVSGIRAVRLAACRPCRTRWRKGRRISQPRQWCPAPARRGR